MVQFGLADTEDLGCHPAANWAPVDRVKEVFPALVEAMLQLRGVQRGVEQWCFGIDNFLSSSISEVDNTTPVAALVCCIWDEGEDVPSLALVEVSMPSHFRWLDKRFLRMVFVRVCVCACVCVCVYVCVWVWCEGVQVVVSTGVCVCGTVNERKDAWGHETVPSSSRASLESNG